MEAVTSVLLARAHDGRGLSRMLTVSTAAHGVLVALLFVAPSIWGGRPQDDVRPVMTISLGGAPGPRAGGMTMMGRPIQSTAPLAQPPEPVRRAEPARPPAAKAPAMVLPTPTARPARRVTTPKTGPAEQATRASAPPTAPKAAPAAEDPARGMGFGGLSTGGASGTGGYLEVSNFCCPDYLVTMLQLVQGNWNARQEVAGETLVKFRIERDGRITGIELERSSGYAALDLTAQRALFLTQRVPPLPAAFPDASLTVHLRFQYAR